MTRLAAVAAIAALLAAPAFAESHAEGEMMLDLEFEGDAAAGEAAFKQCISCHVVVDDEGNKLAGRNGKTGPNLYAVMGRPAGSVEGFRYSKSMLAAGEKGLVWDEQTFVAFVQDPTGFLREYLDDKRARSKMSLKVRKPEDALNLAAFLASLAPLPTPDGDGMTDDAATN